MENTPNPVPVDPSNPSWLAKHKLLGYLFLVVVFAAIVGGIYVWKYGGSKQEAGNSKQEKQTQDPTADWKIYTNSPLGFSIKYPIDAKPSIELNDQYNRLTGFGKLPGKYFEVRLEKDTDPQMGVTYGFLGSDVITPDMKVDGAPAFKAISTTGYGDAGALGSPFIDFGIHHNGDVYHIVFYGDAVVSAEENQILSTFKFTGSADATADWKTYTNSQYGFEFKYPSNWDNAIEENYYGQTFGDTQSVSVTNKNITVNIEESLMHPSFNVMYLKDTFGGSIDTYLAKYGWATMLSRKITKDVGNTTTYVIEGNTPPVPHNFLVVFKNGYTFQLTGPRDGDWNFTTASDQEVVSQILSTFKFTK